MDETIVWIIDPTRPSGCRSIAMTNDAVVDVVDKTDVGLPCLKCATPMGTGVFTSPSRAPGETKLSMLGACFKCHACGYSELPEGVALSSVRWTLVAGNIQDDGDSAESC